MKTYRIGFSDFTFKYREALDNFEHTLGDLEGYFTELVRYSKKLPFDASWMRSDFDCAWDDVERVHSQLTEDFEKYDDDDTPCSDLVWGFVLEGGTWAQVVVEVPTEAVKEKPDVESWKALCKPLWDKLTEDNPELRVVLSIAFIDVTHPEDEEAEDAA